MHRGVFTEKRRRRNFTDEFKAKAESMTCAVSGISSDARAMALADSPSFHLRQSSARPSAKGFRSAIVMQHSDLHAVVGRYGVATTG